MRMSGLLWGALLWAPLVVAEVPIEFSIPVGNSPYSLALSDDGRRAVVSALFPERLADGSDGANLRILDLTTRTEQTAVRIGTRLVSATVAGQFAILINEDEDTARVVDLATGQEVARIPVGSRPSSVMRLDANTVLVTNGTSGDVSVVDLGSRSVTQTLRVGGDPRAIAAHPGGRYLYVVLGDSGALGIIDRGPPGSKSGLSFSNMLTGVIRNPVTVETSPNGEHTVVASPTSNSVAVIDSSNPSDPQLRYTLPVGEQPTEVSFDSDEPNKAYVANLGSSYISVLDLSKSRNEAFQGVVPTATQGAAVAASPSSDVLLFLQSNRGASLVGYSRSAARNPANLSPAPEVSVPGEPKAELRLTAEGSCAADFHIAEVTLTDSAEEGYWGLEVALSEPPRELTGGFNLGGVMEADGRRPGFGAFSLSRRQAVRIRINAQGFGAPAQLQVEVLAGGSTPVAGVQGSPVEVPLELEQTLDPGFYVVRVRSLAGAPRATFQMALEAPGGSFNGGVVVGGMLARRANGESHVGFGGFCLPATQTVTLRTVGASEYQSIAASDLVLTVRDAAREVLQQYDTSVGAAVVVTPPAPPPLPATIHYYVDAAAPAGGNGSAARPLRSITEAVNLATDGQVIFVRPGTYSPGTTGEVLPIGNQGPGLFGLRPNVKLIGAGAEDTLIDAEYRPGNAVVIPVSGVHFAGFTVKRASAVGVFVINAEGVRLERNLFSNNLRFGAGGTDVSRLVVSENVASGNLETGLAFAAASSGSSPEAAIADLCPASPTGRNYGVWIVRNNASNNRADGILVSQGGNYCVAANVTVNNGSSGVEFNNRQSGVVTPAPLNGVVVDNLIQGNGAQQFAFAGTGILSTENDATIDLIQGNRLLRNRPYGIGIFLQGRAGRILENEVTGSQSNAILVRSSAFVEEIADNRVTGSGDSAIFIDDRSEVLASRGNQATFNDKGMSVLSGSQLRLSQNDRLDDNATLGLELRDAELTLMRGASITRNGVSKPASGSGIQLRVASRLGLVDSRVDDNFSQGGAFVAEGSQMRAERSSFDRNSVQGVFAVDAGSLVELFAGSVIGTQRVDGQGGFGVNVQREAVLRCNGTTLSQNAAGNVFVDSGGSAPGC